MIRYGKSYRVHARKRLLSLVGRARVGRIVKKMCLGASEKRLLAGIE